MLYFDFLTIEQVLGGKQALPIFKMHPELINAPITDYAILLGGLSSYGKKRFNAENKDYRTGSYWTSSHRISTIRTIDYAAREDFSYCYKRGTGARPIVKYSKIKDFVKSEKIRKDGCLEVEYGEYPQFVVEDLKLVMELERLWNNGDNLPELKFTDKAYSYDTNESDDVDEKFYLGQYLEVEYNGNKYVKFTVG